MYSTQRALIPGQLAASVRHIMILVKAAACRAYCSTRIAVFAVVAAAVTVAVAAIAIAKEASSNSKVTEAVFKALKSPGDLAHASIVKTLAIGSRTAK